MNINFTFLSLFVIGLVAGCNDSSSPAKSATGGSGGAGAATGGTSATVGGGVGAGAGQSTVSSGGQATTLAGSSSTAGGTTAAATTGPTVTATISVSGAEPKPVSALFFGQNYWSWVPAWGDAVASVETQTKDLKLRFLRAGGANNDAQNPVPFSLSEIDDFVAFAKSVGAEPLLQVPLIKNIAGAAATAQDAADLVTYVNVTKGYGIKYFSIGNEPDLYVDQSLKATGYDAVAFCTEFKAFATAMRAVDSSIKLVGPDLSWKYQGGANDWLTPFLQNCGDVTDVVAIHRYPISPTACTPAAAYNDVDKYRQILTYVRGIMTATGQSNKPLAMTEANITWDGDPAKSTMDASPGTFPAALWLADNLGVSLEAQLDSISYWSLSEGWTLGFFAGTKPRPAFHVLKLFSTQFGSQVLKVTGAPAGVTAYSGRDAATAKTSLFVVNKTNSPVELTVEFTGLTRSQPITLSVSPLSLQLAVTPDDGSNPTVTTYSGDMTAPAVK
jgi:hypothetical protein